MKARQSLFVLALMIAVACVNCRAQEREPSARQLTVELFSSRKVTAVTVTPMGNYETVRMCGECRARVVTKPLTANVSGASVEVRGEQTREVELSGGFRVQPDGGASEVNAAGRWRLRVANGELRVLLTMDSERYVALALAGEAGAKEPMESLKAMAIAVRTYALRNADRHRGQGFGLCDSTHCQVLKFGEQSPQVERAVLETAGETLWYQGRRAAVFYTQNCGGQSEAARSAWPGAGEAYLNSHPDPYCMRHGAAAWNANLSIDQVNSVFRHAGWKAPSHFDAVRVTKRTDAGRALQLEFTGDGVTVPVTASSFRFAMDRTLGWNQLRSDWFTMTLNNGVLHFEGRGSGHGVGLCQAGATEMAAEGHSAAEILSFYFPGTQIGITAEDRGWRAVRGTGWTLWATGSPGVNSSGSALKDLLHEGNMAWGRAQTLYTPHEAMASLQAGSSSRVQPEVWEMPTTELFRQTTTEPGWMLASTAGARVFLQPEAVVKKNGGEEETLLHEFLHVLVESEAAAQAPLWLREGVVEALAKASNSVDEAAPEVSMTAVEKELARPASETESQWAHTAAGRMARALIAQYGLAQVRQWLRTGSVPDAAVTKAQASR